MTNGRWRRGPGGAVKGGSRSLKQIQVGEFGDGFPVEGEGGRVSFVDWCPTAAGPVDPAAGERRSSGVEAEV